MSPTNQSPIPYPLNATKVYEGQYCYVYLQQNYAVPATAPKAIADQFDTNIYPKMKANFGDEPNIDTDSKIYILLLNIKDGATSHSSSYVAGYFDPMNEYSSSQYPHSNQHEMIYMNINPVLGIDAQGTDFYGTIAHEFQHMIHWNYKRSLDDTWLDEGMATVAPTVCGYGPDYGRVYTYEKSPSPSLTYWPQQASLENYAVVYMWTQYLADQLGAGIFQQILHNNSYGINSVNAALSAANYRWDFTGTFRNWTMANYYGNRTVTGHPEWSYTSLDTHANSYDYWSQILPGLFPTSTTNQTSLSSLDQWSVGYYAYTTTSSPGTVTWTPKGAGETASFIDGGVGTVNFNVSSGASNSFTSNGYLIVQNPTAAATSAGDAVTRTSLVAAASLTPATPARILAAANAHPLARSMSARSGRPQHVCVDSFFREREKALRDQGIRPAFR